MGHECVKYVEIWSQVTLVDLAVFLVRNVYFRMFGVYPQP
jgi:hypothetical protein